MKSILLHQLYLVMLLELSYSFCYTSCTKFCFVTIFTVIKKTFLYIRTLMTSWAFKYNGFIFFPKFFQKLKRLWTFCTMLDVVILKTAGAHHTTFTLCAEMRRIFICVYIINCAVTAGIDLDSRVIFSNRIRVEWSCTLRAGITSQWEVNHLLKNKFSLWLFHWKTNFCLFSSGTERPKQWFKIIATAIAIFKAYFLTTLEYISVKWERRCFDVDHLKSLLMETNVWWQVKIYYWTQSIG